SDGDQQSIKAEHVTDGAIDGDADGVFDVGLRALGRQARSANESSGRLAALASNNTPRSAPSQYTSSITWTKTQIA
ncbi:MAG: hypothetical protein EBX78_09065, partial [Gammaproteobacteria bacterium]|nr:hypothetical protein [Gammaproteobacteria bacterium]